MDKEAVKKILARQCKTHEHPFCECSLGDIEECWGAVAQEICDLEPKAVTCPECSGSGLKRRRNCRTCKGTGLIKADESLRVINPREV